MKNKMAFFDIFKKKPESVRKLEKLFDTNLKKVNINKIIDESNGWERYAINQNENIIGLCVSPSHLTQIPSELSEFKHLTHLSIYGSDISDISVLQNLKHLTELYLSSNEISDISVLQNLKYLTELDLACNNITDVSVLQNLKHLTKLDLSFTEITDISVLQNLKRLTRLDLSLTEISDISVLQNLKHLTELDLSSTEITDVSALQNLKNITELDLSSNEISDISALQNLKHLTKLDLSDNPIKILPKWICNFPNMDIRWKKKFEKEHIMDVLRKEELKDNEGHNFITFYDNPIENIPIEILKEGKEAVSEYFGDLEKN